MQKILIVEDDINTRKMVSANLTKRGYDTFEAGDGARAMALFYQQAYDLVILDIVLPDISGVDLCFWMRTRSQRPIMILSGMREEELKVKALNAGADDYITKPFGHDELLARVRAMLRRVAVISENVSPYGKFDINGLSIDFDSRRVRAGQEEIALTKIEYALLVELAAHPDAVVEHSTLLAHVWGPQYQDADHYLHIYFGKVRKKLGAYGDLLETIPGLGIVSE